MKIIELNKDEVSASVKLEKCDKTIEIGCFDRRALLKLLLKDKSEFVCLSYGDINEFDGLKHPDGDNLRMLILGDDIAIQEE